MIVVVAVIVGEWKAELVACVVYSCPSLVSLQLIYVWPSRAGVPVHGTVAFAFWRMKRMCPLVTLSYSVNSG